MLNIFIRGMAGWCNCCVCLGIRRNSKCAIVIFFTMFLEFNYLNIKTSFRRCLASCLSFCKISPLRISKLNLPAEMVETDRNAGTGQNRLELKPLHFRGFTCIGW